MSDANRLPIVLCCAEESEVALVAVVDVLHREGHAPEVAPGVETDAYVLTGAADRVRGPALFVLCQSDDLDRFQVRRLEGLFSARKGPEHRMVTVDVARRSAAAIVVEVRAAARELLRGTGGRDEDDGHYMRDVVMPTSVAAVPGATVPPRAGRSRGRGSVPRSPVVHEPEGISEEALGLESGEGDTKVIDPLDLQVEVPEPEALAATNVASRAALVHAGFEPDGAAGDGVPMAVPEDFPMIGESSQDDVEIRGAPGRAGWDHSGPVDIERVARPARSDPRAEADETPLPSASSPIDIGRPSPSSTPPSVVGAARPPRSAGRLVLLAVAAAGMAGVVTMAVLHATAPVGIGPSAEIHERGVPALADEPTKSAAGSAAVDPSLPPPVVVAEAAASTGADDSSGPQSDGKTSDVDEGTTGPGATAGSGTTGEPSGSDEAYDVADDEADDGGSDAEDSGAEAPAGDGGGKLVPPPPTTGGADAGEGSLEAAIAAGRVQDVDGLLAVLTGPSTVTWDEAASRCSRRKVAGVGGWRLGTKGQLATLRRAKVLTYGSFWSRSTVGADEVMVLDASSGRTNQWLKIEPNARVVCVRRRP